MYNIDYIRCNGSCSVITVQSADSLFGIVSICRVDCHGANTDVC